MMKRGVEKNKNKEKKTGQEPMRRLCDLWSRRSCLDGAFCQGQLLLSLQYYDRADKGPIMVKNNVAEEKFHILI